MKDRKIERDRDRETEGDIGRTRKSIGIEGGRQDWADLAGVNARRLTTRLSWASVPVSRQMNLITKRSTGQRSPRRRSCLPSPPQRHPLVMAAAAAVVVVAEPSAVSDRSTAAEGRTTMSSDEILH